MLNVRDVRERMADIFSSFTKASWETLGPQSSYNYQPPREPTAGELCAEPEEETMRFLM